MAGGTRAVTGATGGARGEPVADEAISATAFVEHGEALRAFAYGFTRDRPAAEDLVQEAFLRLLTELAAGRPPAHPRAWLFRVAANLATSRARRQGVAARRASELVSRDVVPSPEDELLDREAALALRLRIEGLPQAARMALVLAAHGFSGAEIATRIGRSEPATRSLICRHRGRLRAEGTAA